MRGIASLLVLLLVLSGGCVIRRAAEPPAPGSEAALAAARAALAREAALALQGEIELAVAHPSRPASDTVRDAGRRPGEVLAFFGIEPGMRVADLMAGSGYYTELLARVVGSEGVVYAQLNRYVLDKFGDDALTARLTKPGLENVVRWNRELDALELPEAELDAVLLILFYHDTYWQKTNRAKMNADILKALKPGGLYGVIDHRAAAHAKARDVKTLHRGDAEQIRNEILAIGFVADGGRAGAADSRGAGGRAGAGDSRGTGGSASGARTPPATG